MPHVYRFRWRGFNPRRVRQGISPTIAVALTIALPRAFVDIQLDDTGPPGSDAASDLAEIMREEGWVLAATNPQTPLRAITIKQRVTNELAADRVVAAEAFETVLSQAVTTDAAAVLNVRGNLSATSDVPANVRILIDSVPVGGGATIPSGGGSVALNKRAVVAEGNHNVEVQMRVTAPGTARVRPQAAPDGESATLTIEEIVT